VAFGEGKFFSIEKSFKKVSRKILEKYKIIHMAQKYQISKKSSRKDVSKSSKKFCEFLIGCF
jgi:hypothetical protein